MAYASVHLSTSGSKHMDSDTDGNDGDEMELGNGNDSGSNWQLRRFVDTNSFPNE